MKRYTILLMLVLAGMSLGCEAPPPDATEWEITQPDVVSESPHTITFEGDVPYLAVWLDTYYGSFLMDTGSSLTIVDSSMYGLSPEVPHRVGELRILDTTWKDVLVYPQEMHDVSAPAGIVGMDRLLSVAWYIDYPGHRAAFVTPGSFEPSDDAVLVGHTLEGGGYFKVSGEYYTIAPNRILVDVTIEGKDALCLLDTGATYLVLRHSFFEKLPDRKRESHGKVWVYTATGPIEVEVLGFGPVSLPGDLLRVDDVDGFVTDDGRFSGIDEETGMTIDCLLGGSYLNNFTVWFDPLGDELWLEP